MASKIVVKNDRFAALFLMVFAIMPETAECEKCEFFVKSTQRHLGGMEFEHRYQNSTECIWRIQTTPGSRIKLILKLYRVKHCTENYFAFYDGHSTKDKFLGQFCGIYTTHIIITTTNKMLVVLHSDGSLQMEDFLAFYTTECDHYINNTDGFITSPNYPNIYPNNQLCIWQFQTTPGKRIKLSFDDFNLQFYTSCWFDFLAIYDGATTNDTLLGKYCGNRTLSPLISTTHRMIIIFYSDAYRGRTGFRTSYSTVAASNITAMNVSSSLPDVNENNEEAEQSSSGCEHLLKSAKGYLGGPEFGQRYQNSTECIWRFETTPGNKIKLILKLFKDKDCTVDYFAVYDGHSVKDNFLGHFCGRYTAPIIISTTNRMLLVLHSDTYLDYTDFEAFYTTECNYYINDTNGFVTSPNYPKLYPTAQLCFYEFQTTPGKRIKLSFDHFNLDFHTFCWFDFLAIYDGATTNDTLLGKYCGNRTLSPLISTAHRMIMVFYSDASKVFRGFRASYTTDGNNQDHAEQPSSVAASNITAMNVSSSLPDVNENNEDAEQSSPECIFFLNSNRGYLGGPMFDEEHQNSTECIWRIQTTPGSRIKLILKLFKDQICSLQYVAFYDGHSTNDKSLGKFCGTFTAPIIITTTNRMLMVFHSDESKKIRRFRAMYTTECDYFVNTTDGFITSPNYPNPYPTAELCIWEFQTTPGKTIKLFFDHFNLEGHSFCWFDFVAIYDGATTNESNLLGKYCGNRKLRPLISTSHRMMMVFSSDNSECRTGFRVSYSTDREVINNLSEHPYESIQVKISIIVGEDKKLLRSWEIEVPSSYSFYEVLENIGSLEPAYRVKYTTCDGKLYVAGLANNQNYTEVGLF